MPARKRGYFQTALVTGASSGIGAELARQLAPRCRRLILAARRADRLSLLAAEIKGKVPGCRVYSEPLDVSDEVARARFAESLAGRRLLPDLLVNNAGLGDHGEIATADWERLRRMVDVNILGLLHLTRLFLPAMLAARSGTVVNVSSIAGFIPVPEIGVYAATKAFVTSFSESLRIELRGTGVDVVAICPGPIRTEFGEVARRPDADGPIQSPGFMMMPLERAVAGMVRAIVRRKAVYVPGLMPRLVIRLARALPDPVLRLVLSLGCRARRRRRG